MTRSTPRTSPSRSAHPVLLLTFLIVLASAPAFAAGPEATFDRALTFSGTPTVTISTGSGYIHISPGSDGQFHVVGHVRANPGLFSMGDDEARVKQIAANPPITQTGSIITVGRYHGDDDLFRNISIDYDVTTPRSTLLTAHTGSGEIQADGVGPNSRFSTGSGSIHATHIPGPTTLETGSGPITLTLSGPGDLKVHTGSGSIHVEGLSGALQAGTGSGSIQIAGTPTADWRLSAGSGSIRLSVGSNPRFTLEASTGSGSIHVDEPIFMQGTINRHRVTGTVNGGGPTIRASTGSGDITINGSATAAQLSGSGSLHVPGATDCVDSPSQPACAHR